MDKFLFIIEGIDGSGKTTQVRLLKNAMEKNGMDVRQLKFPNYDDESCALVKMYLRGDFGTDADSVNAFAASSFYAVDRFASFKKHWERLYENGTVLVSDRYVSSNIVHQGSKFRTEEEFAYYCSWLYDFEYDKLALPKPTAVFFLDVPPEVANANIDTREAAGGQSRDIHEMKYEYLQRCYASGIKACDKLDFIRIKCLDSNGRMRTKEKISEDILYYVSELMKHSD